MLTMNISFNFFSWIEPIMQYKVIKKESEEVTDELKLT